MKEKDDILAQLEWENHENLVEYETSEKEVYFFEQEETETLNTDKALDEAIALQKQEEVGKSEELKVSWIQKTISHSIFAIKYFATSLSIFAALMLISNYSAYSNIAYSFIFAEEMETTKNNLIESVDAANLWDQIVEEEEVNSFKALQDKTNIDYSVDMHSVSRLAAKAEAGVDLGIEITPYDNRVVIPKIWKNIPLVEIENQHVEGEDDLNDIFMEELENGIIRYPGSALPWDTGNSFIFWHSSNFPWLNGDYNDVFALLDNVTYDDEVIVYYGQQKYVYKITKKEVISPGDVEVLKSKDPDLSELTLMTCWPIGTTYNRLVVVGELSYIE